MPVGPTEFPAVIADNGTTSAAVNLFDKVLCGVFVPAGFVGTGLVFLVARTADGTYYPLVSGGGEYEVMAAASQYVPLDPAKFVGVQFIKVVSNDTETGGPLTLHLAAR